MLRIKNKSVNVKNKEIIKDLENELSTFRSDHIKVKSGKNKAVQNVKDIAKKVSNGIEKIQELRRRKN